MIFDRVGIYEYIIQIDSDEYSEMFSEYPSHESLERCRGVTVALLHNMRHKRPQRGSEGRLPDVFISLVSTVIVNNNRTLPGLFLCITLSKQ
jgi:hypothetical protein